MISVNEARSTIQKIVKPLPPRSVPLLEACHLVVAENVFAHTDIPAYLQSSMDGYAIELMLQVKTSNQITTRQLTADYVKTTPFTQFLKASIENDSVALLPAQESFRLYSFVQADLPGRTR
jgi:molybdopterin biosynthesis enzyme